MTDTQRQEELNHILGIVAEELDVPPSKYEDAQERYEAVGNWLNAEGSPLAAYNPTIYPQGSFALGTAVRPIGDDDYDVDAVCELKLAQAQVSQESLKSAVGARLKQNKIYAGMLEPEGRRCWTLKYADQSQFHLDILPCIPDDYSWLIPLGVPETVAKHAICITDKETWTTTPAWPKSNPKGFGVWFRSRMKIRLEEARRLVAMEKRAEVQAVPDYEVRTPLQRAVQLLKRHRDLRYNGDEDKPISIIITTLAAHAYDNEADLLDALRTMLPKMRGAIHLRGNEYWVANPVNPKENFADKWKSEPRKRELFFEWLASLDAVYQQLLAASSIVKVGSVLNEAFGERETEAAMKRFAGPTRGAAGLIANSSALARATTPASRQVSRFAVSHRDNPSWPVRATRQVSIRAFAKRDGFRPYHFEFKSDGTALPKSSSLEFQASTNVPRPYQIYWQVVNTGPEAASYGSRGLRGSIFAGGLSQRESTLYRGMHWIECFIVKDGVCVARSGEFVVNIQ